MHQNLVMQQMPGPPQGQPRLPNQPPFYPNQRPMRIPRHQPQNNQPMYSSPPGGPPMAVQMIGPPATTQFMPHGQHPPFMTQPVSVINVFFLTHTFSLQYTCSIQISDGSILLGNFTAIIYFLPCNMNFLRDLKH